jgi:hypothetical protein
MKLDKLDKWQVGQAGHDRPLATAWAAIPRQPEGECRAWSYWSCGRDIGV